MANNKRSELMPGVWLRTEQTDKFKSSCLSVAFIAPLCKETASAYALIPSVLRRGCQSYPDMERLSAALDDLYGGAIEPAVRKKGETQCVGFVSSFLDDAYTLDGEKILEPATKLLGELILAPVTENGVFRSDYVQGEQDNLIQRIRAQVNDKRRYAMQRLVAVMCENEAYGVERFGSEAAVAALTPEILWERYRQLLSQTEVEIFYCGSAERSRVEAALKAAFSALPRTQERSMPDCEIRISAGQEPRYVEEALDVTQGKLSLGFRTGGISVWEEEYPALMIFNAVYGGTTMSKLFMNVREKLSLCYYASTGIDRMKGIMVVHSGIEFDKFQQAKDEILLQLDNMRKGDFDADELEGARRILVSGLRATLDGQEQMEDFWLGQAVAGIDEDIPALVTRLETVTPEQVVAVAQKIELDTVYFLKGLEG